MLTIILIILFFSSTAIAKQNIHDDTATKDQYNNDNNDSNYHCTIIIWKHNIICSYVYTYSSEQNKVEVRIAI